jgi:uncharacterized membrane protein SpoIIM required for sporulation
LLSGLLVRLGLSHFKREYLLGREIDTLNFKWLGRTFIHRFKGEAKSVSEWYRKEIPLTLMQLRRPLGVVLILALVTFTASYLWVTVNVPSHIDLTPDRVNRIRAYISENLSNLNVLSQHLPAPILFFHNARAMIGFLLAGLISFGTFGLTLFMVNIALIGGVMGGAHLVGYSPFLLFASGILPHGLFELTAVFLATAAMLRVGALLVTPQPDKSLGEVLLLSLADWTRVFVGLVLPLLAVAAVMEIYLTPLLLEKVFPFL